MCNIRNEEKEMERVNISSNTIGYSPLEFLKLCVMAESKNYNFNQ